MSNSDWNTEEKEIVDHINRINIVLGKYFRRIIPSRQYRQIVDEALIASDYRVTLLTHASVCTGLNLSLMHYNAARTLNEMTFAIGRGDSLIANDLALAVCRERSSRIKASRLLTSDDWANQVETLANSSFGAMLREDGLAAILYDMLHTSQEVRYRTSGDEDFHLKCSRILMKARNRADILDLYDELTRLDLLLDSEIVW